MISAVTRYPVSVGILIVAFAHCGKAQTSLAPRTLLVYATDDSDSVAVASYYQTQRGIPSSNVCPITLPSPQDTALDYSDYVQAFEGPVQSCLDNVGPQQILYIVLAYIRPFGITNIPGLGLYSLDAYLSDVWDQYTTQFFDPYPAAPHPYYVENQSEGLAFASFQSFADFRSLPGVPLFYSVWRLDGVTPSLAQALVDNAMLAERLGGLQNILSGSPASACFDLVTDPTQFPDLGNRTADWDLLRASQFFASTAQFNVVTDENPTVFGTPPSPNCPNAAVYSGWYNYGDYNDAFGWLPGSIGWDIDSGALADPRGGPWWGPNALLNGLSATSGAMAEPYLEGVPRPSGVMHDLLSGANIGDAFLRNTRWLKWRILNVGDPLYRPFPNGLAPFNAGLQQMSLSLTPRELVGTSPLQITVMTPVAAGPGGITVTLSADNLVNMPTALQVPAGQNIATLLVNTPAVTEQTVVTLTASIDGASATNVLLIDPLLAGPGTDSDFAVGGTTVIGTVYLNDSAPLCGATVQLSTDTPGVASVPATVFVPAGLSQANFVIATSPVTSDTNLNIVAVYAGAAQTTSITVTP